MSELEEFEKNLMFRGAGNFWRPEKEGDQIFGTLIRTAETRSGSVFVIKTEDGVEKMLPSHASLENQFERHGIGIGDKVLIRFAGWSMRKYFGKSIRLYQIAARHPDGSWVKPAPMEPSEEVEGEPVEEPVPVSAPTAAEPKKTRKAKKAGEAPAPKEEPTPAKPVAPKPEVASKEEEVKHFIGQLFDFFDTISVDDLHKYVNETRNFGVPIDVVASMCGLTIFEKDGKRFVAKKKS